MYQPGGLPRPQMPHPSKKEQKIMAAEKNLMSAIAGLSDAKPEPGKAKDEKKPKVVNVGKGGSYTVKQKQ
jgi:hypothetical protein